MVNVQRIRERDLIGPVLRLIAEHGDPDQGLDISKISKMLRHVMQLSEQDREILKGRNDDRFSQVVRNLVSHRTLEKEGLAKYRKTDTYTRGAYFLTPRGHARLGGDIEKRQLDLFGDNKKTD